MCQVSFKSEAEVPLFPFFHVAVEFWAYIPVHPCHTTVREVVIFPLSK